MDVEKKYHKKTILQVIPALTSGGVERGTLEIARKIVEAGNASIVISAGGTLVDKLEQDGSSHIVMDVASKNPFTIWRNAGKISNVIRNYNVDIIHARSRAPAWSCYLAAKATGVKLITTFHGIYNFKSRIKKYYNSIMTEGSKVIAVSNFVSNHIIENYKIDDKAKIEVIHRGVNHEEFSKKHLSDELLTKFREKYNIPSNCPIILLPSRMTRWKGHLYLIDALNEIKDQNFYCILAGDLSKHPNFINKIQDKIREYKIQNRVQLFGNEPNMIGLYGIADIVLSTSIEPEAFGRTIIEAQSMEKIVIATNIGGACETIKDGVTGFHVEPKNSSSLAQKIGQALQIIGTDKEKEMVSLARASVIKDFSLKLMLEKTMSIYNEDD